MLNQRLILKCPKGEDAYWLAYHGLLAALFLLALLAMPEAFARYGYSLPAQIALYGGGAWLAWEYCAQLQARLLSGRWESGDSPLPKEKLRLAWAMLIPLTWLDLRLLAELLQRLSSS